MSRLDAIVCNIRQTAEHITGPEGYSFDSLRVVSAEFLDGFDRVEAEIIKREAELAKNPPRGLLADIAPPKGGAA